MVETLYSIFVENTKLIFKSDYYCFMKYNLSKTFLMNCHFCLLLKNNLSVSLTVKCRAFFC